MIPVHQEEIFTAEFSGDPRKLPLGNFNRGIVFSVFPPLMSTSSNGFWVRQLAIVRRRTSSCVASQAIPLNIAEGNGKATEGGRRRFFEIAQGSALECGAVPDVLEVCGALSSWANADAKRLLDRIVALLTRLGQRVVPTARDP